MPSAIEQSLEISPLAGHLNGSPLHGSFTEAHILAITQAICDYRSAQGTNGPLYMNKDTHALSASAQRTAIEVLVANAVQTVIQRDDGVTPTPVISRAILAHNHERMARFADSILDRLVHNAHRIELKGDSMRKKKRKPGEEDPQ